MMSRVIRSAMPRRIPVRHPESGSGTITVRLLPSGRAFSARIVGSDPARGLTLLQVQGGSAFRPVAVGNSRDLGAGAAVTSIAARADGRAFTLGVGNVTS